MEEVTYREHFKELRKKFLWILFPALAIFVLTFLFSKKIISSLMNYVNIPLESVVSLTPFESIQTSLMLSGFTTLLFIFPMFLFSFYNFTKPAMNKKVKSTTRKYLYGCTFFALVGFTFGIVVFSRMVLNTLISTYQLTNPMWSVMSIVKFIMKSSLSLAVIMQTCMIIPALNNMELINVKKLKKFRPLIIISVLILSAIITPPDIVSQVIMAIPFYGSFELGMLLSKDKGVEKE